VSTCESTPLAVEFQHRVLKQADGRESGAREGFCGPRFSFSFRYALPLGAGFSFARVVMIGRHGSPAFNPLAESTVHCCLSCHVCVGGYWDSDSTWCSANALPVAVAGRAIAHPRQSPVDELNQTIQPPHSPNRHHADRGPAGGCGLFALVVAWGRRCRLPGSSVHGRSFGSLRCRDFYGNVHLCLCCDRLPPAIFLFPRRNMCRGGNYSPNCFAFQRYRE
jgi:hypothetical protein